MVNARDFLICYLIYFTFNVVGSSKTKPSSTRGINIQKSIPSVVFQAHLETILWKATASTDQRIADGSIFVSSKYLSPRLALSTTRTIAFSSGTFNGSSSALPPFQAAHIVSFAGTSSSNKLNGSNQWVSHRITRTNLLHTSSFKIIGKHAPSRTISAFLSQSQLIAGESIPNIIIMNMANSFKNITSTVAYPSTIKEHVDKSFTINASPSFSFPFLKTTLHSQHLQNFASIALTNASDTKHSQTSINTHTASYLEQKSSIPSPKLEDRNITPILLPAFILFSSHETAHIQQTPHIGTFATSWKSLKSSIASNSSSSNYFPNESTLAISDADFVQSLAQSQELFQKLSNSFETHASGFMSEKAESTVLLEKVTDNTLVSTMMNNSKKAGIRKSMMVSRSKHLMGLLTTSAVLTTKRTNGDVNVKKKDNQTGGFPAWIAILSSAGAFAAIMTIIAVTFKFIRWNKDHGDYALWISNLELQPITSRNAEVLT